MKPKLLLLEDEDNFRELCASVLEDEDYTVVAKATPEEAIEAARYTQFDLLLADVRMASKRDASGRPANERGVAMDGIDAATEIRKLNRDIYYVLMTGYTDSTAPSRAMSNGMDYWLPKPFELTKLLKVVRSVLDTKNSHNTHQSQLAELAKGPKRFLRWMFGKEDESPTLSMDQARLNFHKAYFASMQGIQTQWVLTANASLSIWSELLKLEERYEELEQIIGDEAAELGRQYQLLQARMENYAANHSLGDNCDFPMLSFAPLYKGVAARTIKFAAYLSAPTVWLLLRKIPPGKRSSALSSKAHELFGLPLPQTAGS